LLFAVAALFVCLKILNLKPVFRDRHTQVYIASQIAADLAIHRPAPWSRSRFPLFTTGLNGGVSPEPKKIRFPSPSVRSLLFLFPTGLLDESIRRAGSLRPSGQT